MKDNRKWKASKTSDEHIDGGSKCSRTSKSDHTTCGARVGFDLNDDEPVQVSPPSRPMKMDKSKRKGKGKALDSNESKEMGDDMKCIKYIMYKILQLASKRDLRKKNG